MNATDIKLLSLTKSKPSYPTRPGIRNFAGGESRSDELRSGSGPTIRLLSLGKSKPQYPTRPGIRNFAGVVEVKGKKLPFTASTVPDDGSIKKNVGKHYFSFEGGEGDGEYLTCENCEHELSGPLASVVVPALEKLAKAKIATWRHTGGWWSFRVMAKKSAGETKHLGSRRVGPEVAVFKYGIPAVCPIHGKITHIETDVAD